MTVRHSSKLLDGDPVAVMVRQGETERATLIAVGSHGRRRAAGLLLGTVAARMLRDAPCSVLVVRTARDADAWPRTVVAGVDGSLESAAAFTVARSLAAQFGGSVRAVASARDQLDREAARAISPELEEHDAPAVEVLVAASDSTDLIIMGSRGLHGLKALGSVERASRAPGALVRAARSSRAGVTGRGVDGSRV